MPAPLTQAPAGGRSTWPCRRSSGTISTTQPDARAAGCCRPSSSRRVVDRCVEPCASSTTCPYAATQARRLSTQVLVENGDLLRCRLHMLRVPATFGEALLCRVGDEVRALCGETLLCRVEGDEVYCVNGRMLSTTHAAIGITRRGNAVTCSGHIAPAGSVPRGSTQRCRRSIGRGRRVDRRERLVLVDAMTTCRTLS